MQLTGIEWTDLSGNPLKFRRKSDGAVVWACVKSSPGCANCYAEKIALRWNRGKVYNAKNMEELVPFLDEKELHKMLTQQVIKGHQVSRSRCFIGDMTDIFGPWVPCELIDRLFAAFALRPDVTWQVLTKWPERMAEYLKNPRVAHVVTAYNGDRYDKFRDDSKNGLPWPLPNVWLGTSVENQEQADKRIPHLLQCPASVRFLSCEPLLSSIDFRKVPEFNKAGQTGVDLLRNFWVISGCESGPKRRPTSQKDIERIQSACATAGVAFFNKQMEIDGKVCKDMSKFPIHLQVREFPQVETAEAR